MTPEERLYLSALESASLHIEFSDRNPDNIKEIVIKRAEGPRTELMIGDVRILVKLPESLSISDGPTMAVDFEILDVLAPKPARKAFLALLKQVSGRGARQQAKV